MKSNNVLTPVFLLLLVMSALLLATCKKDDNNSGTGYRVIKAIYSYEQQQFYTRSYDYVENKMSQMHGYNENEEEIARVGIDYPDGNSIGMIYTFSTDTGWTAISRKELKLNANHVTEVIRYELSGVDWHPTYKQTFSYTHDNIIEFNEYGYESGNWRPDDRTVYEYDGHNHSQTIAYHYNGDWEASEKLVFKYIGNQVDTILGYIYKDGSYTETCKIAFNYEGNLIKSYTKYFNEGGSWVANDSVLYTYDQFNNLESYSFPIDDENYKVEFIYEKGSGNYMDLVDYYEYDFFLDIEPHPVKAIFRDPIPNFFNLGKNSCQ